MAHYTSRAEGLKVKEYKDYYDWNDDIRIRYNPNASHDNWTFTVLFSEGIWMDGVLYPEGSVIASFKDGTEVYYVMLAQHKEYDPVTGEVISMTNFTYRVSSSLSTESDQVTFAQESSQEFQQTGDEELDDIRYTVKSIPNGNHKDIQVKKYKNGTLTGTSIVTPDKITSYKVAHSQAYYKDYPVFNHLGFLWHGMNPESGYPQYSYTLVSRCDHLEVNGSIYGPHDPIRTWTWDQDIDLEVIDVSIPAEPYVPIDDKYPVIQIQFDTKAGSQDTIVVSKISDGVVVATKDVSADNIRESKLKGSKYRIFENLLLDWHGMDPESGYPQYSFTLISDSNYIKYDGNYVWQNTEIKTWQRNEIVSFQVVDETNRHSNVMKKNDVFNVHLSINNGAEQTIKKGDGIYSAILHDHIKMYYNGKYHYAAWLAYDQPNVPGHYKTLGNLAIGYCRPYWVLITTAEGIYFNGHTYQARKLLKTWSDDDVVHLTLTQKKARKKTELNDKDSELIKYTVVTDENDPKITLTKYVNDLETAKSTFNPTLVESRTFNGIKFEINNGLISMYSKSDYVKFQNEGYKAKAFITSWDVTEKVNYEVYDKDFDKIQYIMDTALDSNLITISKQINDLDDDVVTFNPDTTASLDFHNIRFQVSNGKIRVYSKSDFVKLSGTTYKKGNLITSWPIEEKVYFAIVDESIKYEVITAITYNVDTEQVTEIDYDIETMSDEKWKPLKVQKKVPVKDPVTGVIIGYNYAEEKIIDYYDCVRPPYVIYDNRLQFEFNLGYYCWYLKSASDDVYINNEQYPVGALIRSWNWSDAVHYDDIGHITDSHKEIRLKSTTVDTKKSYETTHEYVTDPTYHVETKTEDRTLILTCDQPGSSTVTHNLTWHEITTVEWYTFYGLQFRYRTEEGWKVRANNNLIVKSNKRYSKGQVIFEWGYADNVDFGIDTLLEDIKHTQRTDEEKALMVSKDDEWMYGYIWKRYATPGPTPTDIYDILFPIAYRVGYYYSNSIVGITRNLDAVENAFTTSITSWDNNIQYIGNYGTRIYFTGMFTYNGPISLLFADSFGNDWDEIDGFDGDGCMVIGMMNMTTAICAGGLNGRYYTKLQSYTVASSASKNFDNDISSIITNASYISAVKAYSLNNVLLSVNFLEYIYNYSFESNSIVHDIKAEIQSDISAAEAQWNFTHFSPDGFIEQQRVMGYSVPISAYCFELNGKVYMFIKHVYIHYHSGYIWGGEQQDYDVEDWGCCCYIVDQNGAGEIHKNVMTPEDFENFVWWTDPQQQNTYERRGPFEYNGNYYFHYVDSNLNSIRIATFDPVNITFTLVKTLTNSDSVLVRNLATGHYMNVYFDTRAYSVSDDWVGAMGFTSGSFATKGSHVMSSKVDPNDTSRHYYIFFANPLLETNAGNFIIHDDTRISN